MPGRGQTLGCPILIGHQRGPQSFSSFDREMPTREGAEKPRLTTAGKNEARFRKTFLIDRECGLETRLEFPALAMMNRPGQLFQKLF